MPTHLTPVTAKDDLYSFVNAAFAAYLVASGEACEVRWQGKAKPNEPGNVWVRFSMQQVLSPLRGFIETQDSADLTVYETAGLFFAQVNVAMSEADSFRRGDLLATALRDMVRDKNTPGGIWLRNARFNEIPSDAQFYKWNVVAEYEYDEAG